MSTDNLTHHLVPRAGGMTCKYCKVVNASVDEVCQVRARQEGYSEVCDHCGGVVRLDRNGYWVGDDATSDCGAHDRGHQVNGSIR